tara:strand:- start:1300 stop:1683 length:384 start_codon:yes stop_codon:yes gene_type:complete
VKQNFHSILKKKDGELVHTIKAKGTLYKKWIEELPEDTRIEIFASVSSDDGTSAQIAKVHAMIREIANNIGYTFSEMKLQVKRKAGLCFNKNGSEYCKSFGDCSKQELNLVIQELIEIGDFSGINLR